MPQLKPGNYADGLPILGSAKVSDNALAEAAWIVRHLLAGRDEVRKAMIGQKLRAVIMAKDEYTTDVADQRGEFLQSAAALGDQHRARAHRRDPDDDDGAVHRRRDRA